MTTEDSAVDPAEGEGAEKPVDKRRERAHLPVWQETILLMVVALGLAIVMKALFIQAFYIPSESMEPGLVRNDRILVQKVSYWFGGTPDRGDVIVFKDPGQWLGPQDAPPPDGLRGVLSKIGLYPTGGHLVKRVIGVEGDVIVCCDVEGRVSVNGKALAEDYLGPDPGACNAPVDDFRTAPESGLAASCDWTIGPIPKGKLFVMGDNRGHSADSRAHLCGVDEDPCTQSPWVDTSLVVGRVFTLIWPRDRWSWVTRPSFYDDVPDSPPADLRERAEELNGS